MHTESFTHYTLWHNPLSATCYFALMMCFASFWIRRTIWLWGSFLAIAYLLGYHTGAVELYTLVPLVLLGLCHWFLYKNASGMKRAALFLLASAISFALAFHLMPGFHNWQIADQIVIGKNAVPYNLWLNLDKPFIGIFVLAWSLPLIKSKGQLLSVMKKAIPLSILGIVLLMFPAIYGGVVKWDPKIPTIFFIWTLTNIFLVTIPEEAFFRGFLQRELYRWFGTGALASVGCVVATSLIFALVHIGWVTSLPFLSLVFVASLIYGAIYQYTQAIEASILCHFGLNFIHFLFFTYPALAK